VTSRDRLVALIVGAVVLLAGFWFLLLSPKRQDAAALNAKISEAQQRLEKAREDTATATAARNRYDADYATVAKLGKAVPADDDVASLVYQLDHASIGSHIDFRSIKLENSGTTAPPVATPAAQAAAVSSANGASTTSSSTPPPSGTSSSSSSTSTTTPPATGVPATQSATAGLPPGSTVGSAGFPTMPFSFVFDGSFFDMEHFFKGVQGFATIGDGGNLSVRGRLLTVDSFALSASRFGFPKVKASINATAYLVPDAEGATAGATPQGPATAAASTTTASSGSSAAPAAATSIAGGAR
jgi:cobalamin biosynthesis Mg chelatase CobN